MAACGTVCSGAHDLPTLTDPAVGSTGDYIGGQYAVFPGLLSVDRCDLFLIHCGQQSSGQGKKDSTGDCHYPEGYVRYLSEAGSGNQRRKITKYLNMGE